MEIGSVGAELFLADGQTESVKDGQTTDTIKPIIAFTKRLKTPKRTRCLKNTFVRLSPRSSFFPPVVK